MNKWGRNYELEIATPTGTLTFGPPFTLEFDVKRTTLTSSNLAQFRIYNLSEKSRNLIRKNRNDFGEYRRIQFRAGYGSALPVVFQGNASVAWSERETVNFITQIESYDQGTAYATGKVNMTFPAGTPKQQVIAAIAATLPNVTMGAIGSYPGTLSRAASYSGNAVDILRELTGGGFYIDNERAFALRDDEYVESVNGLSTINSDTGLLGTPILEYTLVRFSMLFEPRVVLGQKITLTSKTGAAFNGDYKVTAVHHKGIISDAVAGRAVTEVEFAYNKALSGVSAFG